MRELLLSASLALWAPVGAAVGLAVGATAGPVRPDPWLTLALGGSGLWTLGRWLSGGGLGFDLLGQSLLAWFTYRAARAAGPTWSFALLTACVGVAAAVSTVNQGPYFRARLWTAHSNILGAGLALNAAIAIAYARPWRWAGLAIVGSAAGVVATGSRAALAALLVSLAWSFPAWPRRARWLALAALALAGLLLAALVPVGFERLATVADPGYITTRQRPAIWSLALGAIAARFPLGVPSFSGYVRDHLPENAVELQLVDPLPPHAHNLVLQAGVEAGLLGLLGVALTVGGAAVLLGRLRAWRGLFVLGVVLLLNTFDFTWFTAEILYPLWAAIGWGVRSAEDGLAGGRVARHSV